MTADVLVVGRLLADIYPNQLRTPLSEIESFTRFVGGFAGNVATGLARLGVAHRDPLARRRRRPRRVLPRVPRARGRRRLLARCRSHLPNGARVLRGVAAGPLPDHLLPHPELPRLGDQLRRLPDGRRTGGALVPADGNRARTLAQPRRARRARRGANGDVDGARPRLAADALGRNAARTAPTFGRCSRSSTS